MSLKALSEYTYFSRYAQYLPELKRRENWNESVKRVFDMHREKYAEKIKSNPKLLEEIEFAEKQVLKKRVLGSQRALQYGGEDTLKKNARIYNCSGLHIDRPRAFSVVMYLLLAGCGVGFSVQHRHVSKLPSISSRKAVKKTYTIPDTIEGWSDSISILLASYFSPDVNFYSEFAESYVEFDYSLIRPEGSLIAGKFKAPGPKPLERAHEKIRKVLDGAKKESRKLRPIEVYDILMHCADAVISAGLRRSATICLFSKDDTEMAAAKTGDWFYTNPQRGRSNNSVVLKRDEVTREEFAAIFKSVKEFGEPGFVWVDDYDHCVNPCCEISWIIKPNYDDDLCTVGFCNLSEINGRFCSNEENFYQACRAASIIGTLQAGYDEFPYIGKRTEEFVRAEALLGVSITGWMDNPDILFNEKILREGSKIVREKNIELAQMLEINPAARLCTAKPSGHTSCILGTASGIHPHHARRYLRRVQSNNQDWALQRFAESNPAAVETSVWSANKTDSIATFLCEVPGGAILKNAISAVELLDKVKTAQKNWVRAGVNLEANHRTPNLSHSVSNTITVKETEWDDVEKYIFDNREHFTGISLLPESGDLDYPQAPFATVLSANELVKTYGDASIFASGLIVDGLAAFDNNLWNACDAALDRFPVAEVKTKFFGLIKDSKKRDEQLDWIRRLKQFATRYFSNDYRKATHCLKHVSLHKLWVDLSREYKDVNWNVSEETREILAADEQAAVACNGGVCELR